MKKLLLNIPIIALLAIVTISFADYSAFDSCKEKDGAYICDFTSDGSINVAHNGGPFGGCLKEVRFTNEGGEYSSSETFTIDIDDNTPFDALILGGDDGDMSGTQTLRYVFDPPVCLTNKAGHDRFIYHFENSDGSSVGLKAIYQLDK